MQGKSAGNPRSPTENDVQPNLEAKRRARKWWPYIIAPYLIGILWHGIHPIISIFTGDFSNARKSYIDENSLDPNHFLARRNVKYPVKKSQLHQLPPDSALCSVLHAGTHEQHLVHCLERGNLNIVKIIPTGTAVAPVNEALVLVVPPTTHWRSSQLHFSVLQLITRLSSSEQTPWLAKTVLVVAPTSNITLSETMDSFLHSPTLPKETSATDNTLIRHVLVLDVTPNSKDMDTTVTAPAIRILPQGERGLLPNLDLVFLCTSVYSRGLFNRISISPYQPWVKTIREWLQAKGLSFTVLNYIDQLLELLSFEYSLVRGPSTPHSRALNMGIDSLTIQLVTTNNSKQDDIAAASLVTGLEYILRALSNLHERLHHSTSLYLLNSHRSFVKHEEYLVPNLLVIVPCIVRAATIIFMDLDQFCHFTALRALLFTFSSTVLVCMVGIPLALTVNMGFEARDTTLPVSSEASIAWLVALAYFLLLWFVPRIIAANDCSISHAEKVMQNNQNNSKTLQFLACLMVVYTHVALAFSHVSLAFPSAMFWSFLAAFPLYAKSSKFYRRSLFVLTFLVERILIQSEFASYNDAYMRYVYLPLHWIISIVWLI